MPQTIAIVGAGPGIGLAVAERFGQEGFRAALIARNAAKLNDLVQRLQSKGVEAAGFPADVRDHAALAKALRDASTRLGAIDVLLYQPTPTADTLRSPKAMDLANQQLHLDIAVLGAITAVQTVLPAMLERKTGALLFTTAASAQYPIPHTASFGIAAGAALNYARVLYQDLKSQGIYAGIVSVPGLVVQRGQENAPSQSPLPLIAAQDVADMHWKLYTERNTPEAIVGDVAPLRAMAGA